MSLSTKCLHPPGTGRDRGVCPGTFAPALVPGQRDTGTRKSFCPGTKGQRDVPSLGNTKLNENYVIFRCYWNEWCWIYHYKIDWNWKENGRISYWSKIYKSNSISSVSGLHVSLFTISLVNMYVGNLNDSSSKYVKGHSTTTGTEFCNFLTPSPTPLLAHVVFEWPLMEN